MSFLSPLIVKTAAALDRRFGWDRLPRFLGVYTVVGIRTRLRRENLYDTETVHPPPPPPGGVPAALPARPLDRRHLQRPERPAHGRDRLALRPQRADRPHVPASRSRRSSSRTRAPSAASC